MLFSISTYSLDTDCTLTLLDFSEVIFYINTLRTLAEQVFNFNNNNVNITDEMLSCCVSQYIKSVTVFLNTALKFSSTSHLKN